MGRAHYAELKRQILSFNEPDTEHFLLHKDDVTFLLMMAELGKDMAELLQHLETVGVMSGADLLDKWALIYHHEA